jgi:hypothetical protein
MFRPTKLILLASVTMFAACDIPKLTVNTTSKVLKRGQPSLKQEADYDLAAAAIPASLKTVETFHVVNPDNRNLQEILAEGYCQYGAGFVEDLWEQAYYAKDYDKADQLAARATRMFVRCMNYSLIILGKKWREGIFADQDTSTKLVESLTWDQRDAAMWLAIGLASSINQNKDDIAMVVHLSTAKALLDKIVELDDKHNQKDEMKRAMPHVGLALFYTSRGPALGGDPEAGRKHFELAAQHTGGKFLLAKVYLARNYTVVMQDRDMFRKILVEVLQTPPSSWPDQRLAGEIAHRRARRYLTLEKEWFNVPVSND